MSDRGKRLSHPVQMSVLRHGVVAIGQKDGVFFCTEDIGRLLSDSAHARSEGDPTAQSEGHGLCVQLIIVQPIINQRFS